MIERDIVLYTGVVGKRVRSISKANGGSFDKNNL
jgi:hypothetical protein